MNNWKCSKCGLTTKPHYDEECISELILQRALLLKELNKPQILQIGPPLEFNGHFDLEETVEEEIVEYSCESLASFLEKKQ